MGRTVVVVVVAEGRGNTWSANGPSHCKSRLVSVAASVLGDVIIHAQIVLSSLLLLFFCSNVAAAGGAASMRWTTTHSMDGAHAAAAGCVDGKATRPLGEERSVSTSARCASVSLSASWVLVVAVVDDDVADDDDDNR